MKVIRPQDLVNLTWRNEFEPILVELNNIFRGPGVTHNLHCMARALLLLLKEGKKPTAGDTLNRVREEDDSSPLGPRVGYDENRWFTYLEDAINALNSSNPRKALNL